jgi:hypothetical protein
MQVLDPNVVHGILRRELIGTESLASVVDQLLHIFEIPLYTVYIGSGLSTYRENQNSFVAFKASGVCGDFWRQMIQQNNGGDYIEEDNRLSIIQ